MQAFYPSQDNVVLARVIAKSDGVTPITTGTVNWYLVALTGTNAGKWWDSANEEWSATEATAASTEAADGFIGGAVWQATIDEAAWLANTKYSLYIKESGDLHVPWDDQCVPMGAAYDGTVETTASLGVTDICNYALCLMGHVAQANADMLDTFSGNPADPTSEPALEKLQLLYPLARDYAEAKLAPPECLRYAASGAAKSDDDAYDTPGWEYLYAKPTSLAFLGVVEAENHDEATAEDVPVAHLEIGDQIGCDLGTEDILFKYVVRVTDTTKFSVGLTMVIAHRLAYMAARSVGSLNEQGKLLLLGEFEKALEDARGLTARRTYRREPELSVDKAHYRRGYTNQTLCDPEGRVRLI